MSLPISCLFAIAILAGVSGPGGRPAPDFPSGWPSDVASPFETARPGGRRPIRTLGFVGRFGGVSPQDGSDDESLEQFLESRGLDRLLIAQLEMRLDRESHPQRRKALAERLAERYQQVLIRSSDSDDGGAQLFPNQDRFTGRRGRQANRTVVDSIGAEAMMRCEDQMLP